MSHFSQYVQTRCLGQFRRFTCTVNMSWYSTVYLSIDLPVDKVEVPFASYRGYYILLGIMYAAYLSPNGLNYCQSLIFSPSFDPRSSALVCVRACVETVVRRSSEQGV